MIQHISIDNFKSIKHINFDCKKINVFIGGPNAGKSNILEAISLLSGSSPRDLGIRFEETDNLFYDNDVTQSISITAEQLLPAPPDALSAGNDQHQKESIQLTYQEEKGIQLNKKLDTVRSYKYQGKAVNEHFSRYLLPPFGSNLFTILRSHPEVKRMVSDMLRIKGYRLGLRNRHKEIEIIKEQEDIWYAYPYISLSETMKRMIFYRSILATNQHATLLFEEPEAYAYPGEVSPLGELIGFDEDNQFFIVTHDYSFLSSIYAKCPPNALAIFIIYMNNYETKVYSLTEDEISELYEEDIILNWDQYIDEL